MVRFGNSFYLKMNTRWTLIPRGSSKFFISLRTPSTTPIESPSTIPIDQGLKRIRNLKRIGRNILTKKKRLKYLKGSVFIRCLPEGSVGLPRGDLHDFVNLTFKLSGKTDEDRTPFAGFHQRDGSYF